jgi:hypothetical protein
VVIPVERRRRQKVEVAGAHGHHLQQNPIRHVSVQSSNEAPSVQCGFREGFHQLRVRLRCSRPRQAVHRATLRRQRVVAQHAEAHRVHEEHHGPACNMVWDSIKPVSAFALNFNRPLELTIKPPPRWGGWQAPLTFSEPVSQPYRVALSPCIRSHQREIRKWQSLTSGERVAAHGGVEAEGIQRHRADA